MAWVKLHTDILSDPKLMRAARKGARDLHLLPWLMAFAKAANDGGRLSVGGEMAEPDDIAATIPCVTADSVAGCLTEAVNLGILIPDPDHVLRFRTWDDRQSKPSDSADAIAERVKRHRERQKGETPCNALQVTPGNATEKKEKREEEEEEQLQQRPVAADAPTRTPEPVGLAVVEGNTLLGALERAPDLPTMVPPDPPPRPPGMGLVRGGSAAVQRFSAGSYADVTGHLGVVLAEVTTGAARRFRADEKREVMALMLGAYWAAKLHKHPERVKFTKKRVSQLVRVLRENEDDLSELFYVVDGAVRDDYCQGRTQKQHGEKVIELDFLFGSRDRIERLAGHCAGYKAGETHPRVRQIVGGAASGEVVNG